MPEGSRITGAQEFERVLKAMPKRLAERELVAAARAGANVIRKQMRDRAPVGDGTLRKSIRTTRRKDVGDRIEFSVHVGKAFWGLFLEFGTVKMAARPFVAPALDAGSQAAIDRLGKRLGTGIEKTAKELAGQFGSIKRGTRRRL